MSPARSVWMLGGRAVLAAAVAKYRRDLRRDHEQLAAFEREVIDTPSAGSNMPRRVRDRQCSSCTASWAAMTSASDRGA